MSSLFDPNHNHRRRALSLPPPQSGDTAAQVHNDLVAWQETGRYPWSHGDIKGNLYTDSNAFTTDTVDSIDNILSFLMYNRCMYGNHKLSSGR